MIDLLINWYYLIVPENWFQVFTISIKNRIPRVKKFLTPGGMPQDRNEGGHAYYETLSFLPFFLLTRLFTV